jgi:hypothetical protein
MGRRGVGWLVCAAVLLATAWYVGSRFDPPIPRPPVGSVRLGPEPGELVADYLVRVAAELPAPGAPVLALVQLRAEVTPAEAVAVLGGPRLVMAVFHVPLSRVQSALRFVPTETGSPPAAALGLARDRARFAADADAARLTGRPAQVAAAEAVVLGDPGCRCVLAVVVSADRAGLDALAAVAEVRAVHAAPAGVTVPELALAPLLPGQVQRADPLPDDGPVPVS